MEGTRAEFVGTGRKGCKDRAHHGQGQYGWYQTRATIIIDRSPSQNPRMPSRMPSRIDQQGAGACSLCYGRLLLEGREAIRRFNCQLLCTVHKLASDSDVGRLRSLSQLFAIGRIQNALALMSILLFWLQRGGIFRPKSTEGVQPAPAVFTKAKRASKQAYH